MSVSESVSTVVGRGCIGGGAYVRAHVCVGVWVGGWMCLRVYVCFVCISVGV